MHDVFISYSTQDEKEAYGLKEILEANGVKCWMAPDSIPGGSSHLREIPNAIKHSKVFLLLLSDHSQKSKWVEKELEMACRNESPVTILPFSWEDFILDDAFDYGLADVQRYNAVKDKNSSVRKMIERILEVCGIDKTVLLPEDLQMLFSAKKEIEEEARTSAKKDYKIITKLPVPRKIFHGREDVINSIDYLFKNGDRVIFLEGIGGIGKSEIAKQYATEHRAEYENIVFVTYNNSLRSLICAPDGIEITELSRADMTDEEFVQKKMGIIRSMCDEKTLFIVDNFDVDDDECLNLFTEGSHRVIFTTRNVHRGYSSLKVGRIDDIDALTKIFEENYEDTVEGEDKEYLLKLFDLVENHTYMIELLAKQAQASYVSVKELYEIMVKGQLDEALMEDIEGVREQKTAYGHLCKMFDVAALNEDEKRFMQVLSVMGVGGIDGRRLKEWMNNPNMSVVNKLAERSWARKDTGRLSLHPLVGEVVRKNLTPSEDNMADVLENMRYFCRTAWYRKYTENLMVTESVLSLLEYFAPFTGKCALIFEPMITMLWQVGRFEESIKYGHVLYDTCEKELGRDSYVTGFVAKSLGGCYFNSRREKESVKWYERGLEAMIASGEDGADLALGYEKVARCYTWDFNENMEKAEEYFQKGISIRKGHMEQVKRGETVQKLDVTAPYNEETITLLIESVYLEIGRMYQLRGDFEKALESARIYEAAQLKKGEVTNNIAYAKHDIGYCYYCLALKDIDECRFEEADEKLNLARENVEEALKSNMEMRGALAHDTIETKILLSDILMALREEAEARLGYEEAIEMFIKLYDEDYVRVKELREKLKG